MAEFRKCGVWVIVGAVGLVGLVAAVGCGPDRASRATQPSAHEPAKANSDPAFGGIPQEKRDDVPQSFATPLFVDAAQELGIDFTFFNDEVPGRFFLPEVMGGGVAWIDFDRDGQWDLYLVNGDEIRADRPTSAAYPHALFQNRRNKFVRVESAGGAIAPGFGQGCAVGDFDSDGFPDLFVAAYGQDRLFHNQGDGTFVNFTSVAGIQDQAWGSSALWLDVDADYDLDLFVVNYLDVTLANSRVCEYNGQPGYCGPGDYEGVLDLVYINRGDGTFVDAAAELGLVAPNGRGLAVISADLDLDLRPEIYVGNDMTPNFLFTRTRTPRQIDAAKGGDRLYCEVAMENGCAVSDEGLNEASMGVALSDFDGDGLADIFLTHFYAQKNTLYRNLGGLLFADESRVTRIAATSYQYLGFGTCALDYDRDGSSDLFIANGQVLGKNVNPNEMTPQLLRNSGAARFDDISPFAGDYFRQKWLGRGVAGADYDHDGDLDLVITHLHRPVAVLRNDTDSPHHFFGLELQTVHRIPPVGGRVIIRSADRDLIVPVTAGGSYLSSHDARILAGVQDSVVDLEIHWPSGLVDTFGPLAADRYWRIVEALDGSQTTAVEAIASE